MNLQSHFSLSLPPATLVIWLTIMTFPIFTSESLSQISSPAHWPINYRYVDFVNIPAFNFDQTGKALVHPAKLHGMSEMENMVCVLEGFLQFVWWLFFNSKDAIMDLAMALGLPSQKLVVGVPTFGTLYRLVNATQTIPGSPSVSWSENNQPITTISHSKVCSTLI